MEHKGKENKRKEGNGIGVTFSLFGCLSKRMNENYLFLIWGLSKGGWYVINLKIIFQYYP